MKLYLINICKSLLLRANIVIGRTVDITLIQDFLSSVNPLTTNHDLIRIGGETDGGYLIPNDLEGINFCFSPGVCDVANFEEDLTNRGINCFLADYSVNAPPHSNISFDFEKKFLGPIESDIYMTLEGWVLRKAPLDNDLILQMDIEGAEYGVIFDATPELLKRFRILVIEFHRLDSLIDTRGYELINLIFSKILRYFDVVHIHPNNCAKPIEYKGISIPPVMEFTFLRKDRIAKKSSATSFPHILDRANVLEYENFKLPKCWHK